MGRHTYENKNKVYSFMLTFCILTNFSDAIGRYVLSTIKTKLDLKYLTAFLISLFLLLSNQSQAKKLTEFEKFSSNDIHVEAIQIPKKVFLDGIEFKDKYLLETFLTVVFRHDLPDRSGLYPELDKYFPSSNKLDKFFSASELKKNYPWLYEFIYRDKGLPNPIAINKWTKPIKISFGYPNDLKPFRPILFNGREIKNYEFWPYASPLTKENYQPLVDYYLMDSERGSPSQPVDTQATQVLIKQILLIAPVLSSLLGLEVSYIPHEAETLNNYANVRIILVDESSWRETAFKIGNKRMLIHSNQAPKPIVFRSEIEPRLYTAVEFTPRSLSQVDGYFLTNEINQIEMAFCYIREGQADSILKALINECLVRSSGIPEGITPHLNSVLSFGQKATFSSTFSEMDQFIIKLLYHPKITAGMSIQQFLKTVSIER